MVTIHRNKKGTSAEKTQSQSQIYGFFPFQASNWVFFAIAFLCCLFLDSLSIKAQEPDSNRLIITKPLVKQAKKHSEFLEYGKISTKKSLNPNISTLLGNARLQAIAVLLPSIEMKDYGGPGSMNLFSIRGLGPMRNVILLDGIPLASSQTGVFDMSIIPIMPGQTIDVDMGGASSIIGSGAMAGMIELLPPDNINTPFCSLNAGIGSFGELSAKLQGGASFGNSSFMAMADHFQFDGDFPIRFQPSGNLPEIIVNRDNAGNSRQNVFVRASHFFEESKVNTSFWTSFVKGRRGVPGAVLTGKVEAAEANLNESDFILAGSLQAKISNVAQLRFRGSFRISESFFRDPFAFFAGPNGASNEFLTHDIFTHAEYTHLAHTGMMITSGMMFSHTLLRGDLLQPYARGEPKRISGALFSRINAEFSGYDIDAGFRTDVFSDQQGPAVSGHMIVSKNIFEDLVLSTKLTRDFRVPSFNELYYLNYGTQFLLPETSTGIDVGMTYQTSTISAQCSFYHMRVQNQILAIPISPVQWSARNIGMVWSSGFELSFGYRNPAIYSDIQISYAYKDVMDKREESATFNTILPYIPRHTISCSYVSDFTSYAFGFIISGIGERFGLSGELPDSKLKPVVLMNPFIEYRIPFFMSNLRFRGEVRNLLDSDYQMILNFPLPGRSFVLQCGLTF